MKIDVIPGSDRQHMPAQDVPVGRVFTNGINSWLRLSSVLLCSDGREMSIEGFPKHGVYEVLPLGTKFNITT